MHDKRIFAFDAESNGLWGRAFAIGAYVIDPVGRELARFTARCPIDGPVDTWVTENVLPALEDLHQTHDSYSTMLEAFYAFYAAWVARDAAHVIAHVALPVETTLLRDMLTARPGREWQGPFPLLDVATALQAHGHDSRSVEDYNRAHRVAVPLDASPHHPLYGAAAAALCWQHLLAVGVGPDTVESDTGLQRAEPSTGKITLQEFFDDVERVQQGRRDRGVVTLYFQHQTLTPGNVRLTWEDVPVSDVPAEGTVLDVPAGGYDGADARWRVVRQAWLSGAAVILHVADPEPDAGNSRPGTGE